MLITSRFESRCCVCRGAIAKGEQIHYDRLGGRGSKATHIACKREEQPREPAPRPEPAPRDEPRQEPAPSDLAAKWDDPAFLTEHHFDSVSEFMASCVPTAQNEGQDHMIFSRESPQGESREWYGLDGGPSVVVATVAAGWADGWAKVERSLQALNVPAIAGLRRRAIRADFGDEVDIHRVNAGDFENAWTRRTRRHSEPGHAQKTILVALSGSVTMTAEQLFWRGAVACKLSDAMTAAGYQVEIVGLYGVTTASACGRHRLRTTLTIKAFNAPLDGLELAAVTCLAGFLRYYGFKHYMSQGYRTAGHLGVACADAPERYTGPDVIRGLETVNTKDAAQAFIDRTLEALTQGETE